MKAVENLRKAGNTEGKVYIVPGAGHHGEDCCCHVGCR